MFSKLDRKKKAAFIAPKQPGSLRYQVSKGLQRKLLKVRVRAKFPQLAEE